MSIVKTCSQAHTVLRAVIVLCRNAENYLDPVYAGKRLDKCKVNTSHGKLRLIFKQWSVGCSCK